jgi:hypothetical protein
LRHIDVDDIETFARMMRGYPESRRRCATTMRGAAERRARNETRWIAMFDGASVLF